MGPVSACLPHTQLSPTTMVDGLKYVHSRAPEPVFTIRLPLKRSTEDTQGASA